jgi:hypothetical protein
MKNTTSVFGFILRLAWILTLVGLPLTCFPLLARPTRSIVAPFSFLPTLILVFLWLIPYMIREGELPVESKPIFVFLIIVLISSTMAFFIQIPDVKNLTVASQEMRASFSLVMGLSFYFIFAAWLKSPEQLEKALQWIYIGGAFMLIWTILQAYFIFWHSANFPGWIALIQDWLAVRSPVFSLGARRVIGLTYEPAWFAHMLVLFYIPLWMAASFERKSVFHFRLLGFSIENILLAIGFCVFFLSSPRVSLLSFLLIIFILFVRLNKSLYNNLNKQLEAANFLHLKSSRLIKITLQTILAVSLIAIYGVVFGALFYLGSLHDWRLALITQNIPSLGGIKDLVNLKESTLLDYGNRLAFLERVATWIFGWRVFNLYPWLGVGIGNAGFFAHEQMPSLGWASAEIRILLNDPNVLPNIKNLWLRILAETGLVGFSTILVWIYFLWRSTRLTIHSFQPVQKVLAFAGELFLVAFIIEGFNVDYYAMPYMWVFAGLISANGWIYRSQFRENMVGVKSTA